MSPSNMWVNGLPLFMRRARYSYTRIKHPYLTIEFAIYVGISSYVHNQHTKYLSLLQEKFAVCSTKFSPNRLLRIIALLGGKTYHMSSPICWPGAASPMKRR